MTRPAPITGSASPRLGRLARLLAASALLTAACATLTPTTALDPNKLPPILAQDEIIRPYTKIGTVEVSRERLGHIDDLKNEADEWAYDALGAEAAKLGADAIILPEVQAKKGSYLFFPSTSIKAKGIAIRFN
ncbi:hypothetical protein GeomeDRAFT_3079 [Geobacter metallireducens RCH3]|uniref:Lipoprotein, putative n=1 Tax=Geobacter metallireducens (strain ATCC 53774 / DSM 7210 / GS-15) TaxID=269799 RepID=Q39XP0_GEOMG|nr:hypothetical protein [Geobacter metallireducens]ABB30984.1 lipoprotein, putative [Geobacter metallireducens GS-15]EHP84460.1 hypothetical protein GeomeDRAFT_3079 [Geobacter metallireducens RCH3]